MLRLERTGRECRASPFPGSDEREVVAVQGTAQSGHVVAVTVEPERSVDAPTSQPIVASESV